MRPSSKNVKGWIMNPPRDINAIYQELSELYAEPVPEHSFADWHADFMRREAELWVEARRASECNSEMPMLGVLAVTFIARMITSRPTSDLSASFNRRRYHEDMSG